MPNSRKSEPNVTDDVLARLLRESAELRHRSEALAAEVEALRYSVAKDGQPRERRKKPRLRGK